MSTNELFTASDTLRGLHEGPLGSQIDAYAARLLEQGFSSQRACDKVRLVADLSSWLQRNRLSAKYLLIGVP
jgi:hypothetical protein